MTIPLESAIVRIYSDKGSVIGAGFLVSQKHVLTCAHVVAFAAGTSSKSSEMPTREVSLDFPRVEPGKKLLAKVVFWLPVNPDKSVEDIAVLELASPVPETAKPVHLVTSEELWGDRFRVLGFPAGQPSGVWASGELRARTAKGWVHLEDVKEAGYALEEGFSGSPVWDEKLDGVVGMAVAADKQRPDVKAAFIIPKDLLVSEELLVKACPEIAAKLICPYRGLLAFREEHAQFFFGRETFTEKLRTAVQSQKLVAVIGPSGSGKSSVVFAGLIPLLRSEQNWLIDDFRSRDRPCHNLLAKLLPRLETQTSIIAQQREINKLVKDLRQGELALRDVIEPILEKNLGTRLLLVVDQFEELYTQCHDLEERQCFLDQLLEAVEHVPNFTVVITLRADFLGYVLKYRPLADALEKADVKLGPMNQQELEEAIEKPAHKCGVQFEPGLKKLILCAVSKEPGNLPLLEFALTQLWEKKKYGKLTHEAYTEIGGVEKALARHADNIYEQFNQKEQQAAQQIFLELTQLGEGTEGTRRQVSKEDLLTLQPDKTLMERVIQELTDQKLLVTSELERGEERVPVVDVIHEALIRHWPLLRRWLEENQKFLRLAHNIEETAQEWQEKGKKGDELLRGRRLKEAKDLLLPTSTVHLPRLAQEFIKVSQKAQRISQLKNGLVVIFSLAGIGTVSVVYWQLSEARLSQEVRNAALDGTCDPKMPNSTEKLLNQAEKYKQKDIDKALSYYPVIFAEADNCQKAIANKPQGFQPQALQKVRQIRGQAETSLVALIKKDKLPKLEKELGQGDFREYKEGTGATQFEEQYTPGALRTTYQLVMGDFGVGADLNGNGLLEAGEAKLIPCEILKEIERLWRSNTQGRCGWYGSDDPYIEFECNELKGETLTPLVFNPPYVALKQLERCQIAPKPRINERGLE
jgi:energy-coupling factor transporter ATP-binding protein EcfA2